ncbi:MAG: substrate-binding domain-containing protein, partial [Eubacteriales bacterium]|nr:substrate-binding domain-containing protein [Eubacteriales bacterium]
MKKFLTILLALSLCLAFSGGALAAGKTIAGVVFQEDQFMKTLADGYAAAAKDLGYEILQANTNNDQSKESEIINTYVSQGIAGLAISPLNSDTSPAVLKDASDAGLVVAVCNTHVDSFPFAVANYSADNFTFCNQTGQAAVEFIKANYPTDQKIRVALVQFKTQIPEQSADRVNGFLKALEDAGIPHEVVADQDAWLQDMAVAKAGDMLSANPNIDIIYAANDGGTVGSTMAVENAGLAGKVFVFGTDGSEQIVGLLKDSNNILQAVTAQDPYEIGYKAVTALVSRIEGRTFDGEGKDNIIPG